jgi:glutamate/tyrosine decarboxylase-like PLP-dependent enzyme
MTRRYEELLDRLRLAFPQPVSDPVHDAYFVYSISRALEQIDNLKSQAPILGAAVQADYLAARTSRVPERGESIEHIIPQLVKTLEGMFIWGHPACQVNVVPPPSIASIIGVLLPSTYNPNLCSEEGAQRPAETEVRVVSMAAELVGYDPAQADGVFTFGGTGAMLYGVKIGLEKAMPGAGKTGVRGNVAIFSSEQSHYSCLNVASWLGIGQDQVVRVPTTPDNALRVDLLEAALRQALDQGTRVAAIVATLGTTDAFGLDDLAAIVELRDRLVDEFRLDYRPHIHADAVIGWAWSVFRDYDFKVNPLGFRGRTVRALAAADYRVKHLGLADSIGIDFHKTGFVPYVSSLVLVRLGGELQSIGRGRDAMPYLYHTGQRNPGIFTLETTRSGAGPLSALANLLLLGREGIRTLLGHVVDMAETLRERLESHPDLTVLNGENVGPVTLFRVYPHGTDTFTVKKREQSDPKYRDRLLAHNEYNRRIYHRVYAEALAGRGVALSLTECYRKSDYGEPIVALKSYILSPFSTPDRVEGIVEHVLAARDEIEREQADGVAP